MKVSKTTLLFASVAGFLIAGLILFVGPFWSDFSLVTLSVTGRLIYGYDLYDLIEFLIIWPLITAAIIKIANKNKYY